MRVIFSNVGAVDARNDRHWPEGTSGSAKQARESRSEGVTGLASSIFRFVLNDRVAWAGQGPGVFRGRLSEKSRGAACAGRALKLARSRCEPLVSTRMFTCGRSALLTPFRTAERDMVWMRRLADASALGVTAQQ